MINLQENKIFINGTCEGIKFFRVWWRTPIGLYDRLEHALEMAKKNDWPSQLIRPVPVAIGQTVYEEML